MKISSVLFLILFYCCLSCKQSKETVTSEKETQFSPTYAKGFSISKTDSYTKLTIHTPWPNAKRALEYYLIPKEKSIPKSLLSKAEKNTFIKTPLKNIVVCSTTDIPLLEALNTENTLVGFPEPNYISSIKTRKRIDSGLVKDVGNLLNLNTEIILEMQPELIVGFSATADTKAYELLEQAGIPILMNGSWLESHPLGRAEWIKVFGLLYGKEKEANAYFAMIESEYNNAVTIAKQATSKPTVLSGNMYKDVWYAPGGNSYIAKLINDANGNYYWKNTTDTGSLSLSFESVYDKANAAEIWIDGGAFTSINSLVHHEEKYGLFSAVKNNNVYSKDLKKGATNGILYYELSALRADWILKDLIKIFHPNLAPNYSLHFYQKLH